jgi:peptide/nickel transport system permease protein
MQTHDVITSIETQSQWQLIQRRFFKHKLAVVSLFFLLLLYMVAVFAELFAPYAPFRRDLERTFCPAQLVHFSFTQGFYCNAVKRHIDPISFRKTYREDLADRVPLSFLAVGEPYKLWGLVPLKRRFFGVDTPAYYKKHQAADGLSPSFYLLGTDKYGQDILSRIILGSRISLSVGLIGILFTFILGVSIGGISGYVGGGVDTFLQRVIEIINSFPQLPMWLALAAIMPGDWSPLKIYFAITIVLSFLNWTHLARVVRGKILSLREEDYAMAARLLGASHRRIIFRHLVPGFTSHIIVALTLSVPGMILGETSLSFLGLGLRPPIVSWGVMLQDCMNMAVVQNYPWLLLPVVFIIITVLCFNFLGDGLRDAADPYSSR